MCSTGLNWDVVSYLVDGSFRSIQTTELLLRSGPRNDGAGARAPLKPPGLPLGRAGHYFFLDEKVFKKSRAFKACPAHGGNIQNCASRSILASRDAIPLVFSFRLKKLCLVMEKRTRTFINST